MTPVSIPLLFIFTTLVLFTLGKTRNEVIELQRNMSKLTDSLTACTEAQTFMLNELKVINSKLNENRRTPSQ